MTVTDDGPVWVEKHKKKDTKNEILILSELRVKYVNNRSWQ
jgi:hypothetical protein